MDSSSQKNVSEHLSKFWKALLTDLQKKIGQNVAMLVMCSGTSNGIMSHVEETPQRLQIELHDFDTGISIYVPLEESEKAKIRTQLSD